MKSNDETNPKAGTSYCKQIEGQGKLAHESNM